MARKRFKNIQKTSILTLFNKFQRGFQRGFETLKSIK